MNTLFAWQNNHQFFANQQVFSVCCKVHLSPRDTVFTYVFFFLSIFVAFMFSIHSLIYHKLCVGSTAQRTTNRLEQRAATVRLVFVRWHRDPETGIVIFTQPPKFGERDTAREAH